MSWAIDENGYPVLLSDQEVLVENEILVPISSKTLELARRRDAVRDAAREFEDLSDQDIQERLRGKTTKELAPAKVAAFRADVRQQVLDDLVDVLDNATRGRLRSRRMVRVVAPKGYRRKVIRGLSDDEREQVRERLLARGWSEVDARQVLG